MGRKKKSVSGGKFLALYLITAVAVTVSGSFFAYDKYMGIF